MLNLHERAHGGAREKVTTIGTTFAASVAQVDAMQLRWELQTSRRPGPLRGTVMLRRRCGGWVVDVGTFVPVWDLCAETGDDRQELEGEVRAAALRFAEEIEGIAFGDTPIPYTLTALAGGAR